MIHKISVFSLVLLLAACASRDFYPEGTAVTAGDQAMLETIQRAFWEVDGIDETDLTVMVDHRNVWVTGRVNDSKEKQRILDVLRSVDGIGQININGLERT